MPPLALLTIPRTSRITGSFADVKLARTIGPLRKRSYQVLSALYFEARPERLVHAENLDVPRFAFGHLFSVGPRVFVLELDFCRRAPFELSHLRVDDRIERVDDGLARKYLARSFPGRPSGITVDLEPGSKVGERFGRVVLEDTLRPVHISSHFGLA